MTARITGGGLSKTFVLTEHGGAPQSLWYALRTARPRARERVIRAVEDVSFEVREGERVGIVGRNGAGKTTLLSLIAGVSVPTAGRVEIEGRLHSMLTLGAVVRDEATGRENIRLDGAVSGRTEAEIAAYVNEIAAFAELGEFIDRPVRTYSSGMKARLAFAMGIAFQPDVLIIDETLAVGDYFFAKRRCGGCASHRQGTNRDDGVAFCGGHQRDVQPMPLAGEGRLVMEGAPGR